MKNTLDKYLEYILVGLIVIMTLDVLWGVFTRYALGSQASWTEELARFLLIWIGMLGAAYASGQKMHLAIDLLPEKLGTLNQKRLEILILGLVSIFAIAVMVIGGFNLVSIAIEVNQKSAALQLSMGWVYAIIPISGSLVFYYQAARFSQLWSHFETIK